jgi:hypothetical protein
MAEILQRFGIWLRLGAILVLILCGLVIPAIILAISYIGWDFFRGASRFEGNFHLYIKHIFIDRSVFTSFVILIICFLTGHMQLMFWVLIYAMVVAGYRLFPYLFRFILPGVRLTPVSSSMGLMPRILMVFAYGSGFIQIVIVLLLLHILHSSSDISKCFSIYPYFAILCAPVSYIWARRLGRDFSYYGAFLLIIVWPLLQFIIVSLVLWSVLRLYNLLPNDPKDVSILLYLIAGVFVWLCGSLFLRLGGGLFKAVNPDETKVVMSGNLICELFTCAMLGLGFFLASGHNETARISNFRSYEFQTEDLIVALGMALSAAFVSRAPWLSNMKWWEAFIRPLAGGAAVACGDIVFKLAAGLLFGLSPEERGWLILLLPLLLGKALIFTAFAGGFGALTLLPFRSSSTSSKFSF